VALYRPIARKFVSSDGNARILDGFPTRDGGDSLDAGGRCRGVWPTAVKGDEIEGGASPAAFRRSNDLCIESGVDSR